MLALVQKFRCIHAFTNRWLEYEPSSGELKTGKFSCAIREGAKTNKQTNKQTKQN